MSHKPSAISQPAPALVHFTGVHLWNVPLVWALRRRGVPVVHTLHDLRPHGGVRHGGLISLWNRLIIGSGAHILVHGRRYRDELIARGLPPERVTYLPLLHGFWGYQGAHSGRGAEEQGSTGVPSGEQRSCISVRSPQCAVRSSSPVLFFGRVEAYKGVDLLLEAWEQVRREAPGARLVIAGLAARDMILPPLPAGVEWRNRRIDDSEAIELFRTASLLVLPYRDATQSALIAAAYACELPVIVTDVGALPEYVAAGETGWIVPPGEPAALAAVIREALLDPERLLRMGQAGRAWYEEQRTREEAALAAMYSEVMRSTS